MNIGSAGSVIFIHDRTHSDPELFTAIRNSSLYERKVRNQHGSEISGLSTRVYGLKTPLYVQLSRFPGLESPFGVTQAQYPEVPQAPEHLTIKCPSYLEEFDEKLRDSFPQFSQAEYKPLAKKFRRGDREYPPVMYLKINDKTKFYTFGDAENIVDFPIDFPKERVVRGSHIVPVLCISGVWTRDGHWGTIVYVQDCFVLPPQEEVRRPLFRLDLGDVKAPVAPAPEILPPSDIDFCSICIDQRIAIVFLPCGHFCTCTVCSERCQTCPICRSRISRKINWARVAADVAVFRV